VPDAMRCGRLKAENNRVGLGQSAFSSHRDRIADTRRATLSGVFALAAGARGPYTQKR
jgi:hypothetical protein